MTTPSQLEAWDKHYVWHPFTQMQDYEHEPPLVIQSGKGAYLFDIHGRQYFDGNSSIWVNLHGHAHPHITRAIQEQAQRIAHSTLLGSANVPSIQLAKRLAEVTPTSLDKVFYSDNGSTAVEVALKMAFQYWRHQKPAQMDRCTFITFEQSYHGDTLGSVSVGGIELFHGLFHPLLFETHAVPYPVYSRYTDTATPEEIGRESLQHVENALKTHGSNTAAIIIEPIVQGACGIRTQAPGFLRGLRELCDRYNVLLIFDEVFLGFGRSGTLFGSDQEGVSPDLLCLAKGITGGYVPLAATLANQKIYDAFLGEYNEYKTFFHGHSFTGNQIGCAAALASLDVFEQENTLERMKPSVERLRDRLDRLFEINDHVKDIHHIGLICGIDLCASRSSQTEYPIEDRMAAKTCFAMRKHGVWLRPLGNTLVFNPPLITTPDEIDFVMDAIETAMHETLGA